ncbi:L,D-transpeptidase family protein [Streptomyces sp. NPDC054904]|uniref:L,D-transpeptidase family protein n=1 Tax=unclassified Streptomyces TaxID=2593676 RepID=UPI002481FD55|nr:MULTISPECIES: L,D-transpeptidase family protein [unclassified Streptomyces]MDA5281138.1 L,D-transpeptidase family protein [Streptomyces sp. Isolate_45]MDX2389620.1 L,D-transpeptidase family protein [Streptomyces sp. DK15]
MYRQKVMIRTLGLAASVVLAATACGPQGSAPAAPGSSASAPAPSPSGPDNKPGGGGSSPTPGTSASPGQPSAQGGAKPIMANGDESDRIRELQARLRQLKLVSVAPTGFYGSKTTAAVKTFQSNNGLPATGAVDEATWQKIQGLSKQPTEEELRPPTSNELAAPDPRCMEGRVMCISKESRTLAWMIDGKVVSSMDVRFGSENTPTREGLFKVDRKERKWKSTLYHTDMPYSMFFSHGQAVHFSQDFASRGYNGASHGCVNVRDMARLSAMFEQVQVGDKVVVYW